MEIQKVLMLSTAHLDEGEMSSIVYNSDVLPVRTLRHEYGMMLFISIDSDINDFDWSNTPNLKPIVEYCLKNNINNINFDCDVEPVSEFKVFDW